MTEKPIFLDDTGRRATRVHLVGGFFALLVVALTTAVAINLLSAREAVVNRLPGEPDALRTQQLQKEAVAPGLVQSAMHLAALARERRARLAMRMMERHLPISIVSNHVNGRPLSIAFFPNWQPSAFDSLRVALPHLDWIMPTWLSLQGPELKLRDGFNTRVYQLVRRNPKLAILPVVQNATLGKWDGAGLATLLGSSERRTKLVGDLTTYIVSHRFQGIVVDFESLPQEAHADFGLFLRSLHESFAAHRLAVVLASPFADDKWPFAGYAANVDYTLLMAYDEHSTAAGAGSIAGEPWFESILDRRMKDLDPNRTIVALGNYAYDWNGGDIDNLSFEEAVIAADDSGAPVAFDPSTNNPHFSYVEDDGTKHDVWFLDAVTAYNQIHAADQYRPAGYALWRLGNEDPSIWSVMGKPYNKPAPTDLKRIPVIEDIDFEGAGELLRVEAHPQSGARTFELDRDTGDVDDESYTKLPTGYVIRQFGAARKTIALTFDDGPDADWTPRILDILKAEHVPATFFIIGSNAEANPELVRRMVDDGHEVGNHTFTHPNLSTTSASITTLELNATQRLFEALVGRSLRLFRPPYLGDAEPTDEDEIVPIEVAQNMGYIAVGEHVDPVDWELPGADKIVARTLKMVQDKGSELSRNIVLFHDAGGDRSQTVEALPGIIETLKAKGYRFTTVSALIGMSRDAAMPPLPTSVAMLTDRVAFLTLSKIGQTLHFCFLAAIWLSILRALFLIGLAVRNSRRRQIHNIELSKSDAPRVSVIIPAYNEERVIVRSVRRILGSTYPSLEVIVVDDGSKDRTFDMLTGNFASDPRVTLLRIANSGKANALNAGLTRATGEVVVALDADTLFSKDAIGRLIRWFEDLTVGAVAGNAKVGNRINIITRWQALEYITAQNLERRALAELGTLTVVPGAIGAWRKSALERLNRFPTGTVAEDQDLTIAIQAAGYRVVFDSSAVAWTEAPTTLKRLARQRFRWAYGTLQCLWKHRALTFRRHYGALGMIAIPQAWLFQILLTMLAPVADLLLISQVFWEIVAYLQHGAEYDNSNLLMVGSYYVLFVLVDLAAAWFGFLIDGEEDKTLLWWLPLQRFGYRQLMYYVVARSIYTALKGPMVGWGKIERTATVVPFGALELGETLDATQVS